MKLRLQLLIESDTGEIVKTEEVAQLECHSLCPEEVGLTLADAKQILGSIQHMMVQEQVTVFVEEQSRCPDCVQSLTRKGQHPSIGICGKSGARCNAITSSRRTAPPGTATSRGSSEGTGTTP